MAKKKATDSVSNPSRLIGGQPEQRYPTACTPEEMIDAVRRGHGIARDAAKILDCTRRTVYAYINRYPEVKQAYKEAREENVDVAENRQLQALNKGERWAIENWLFYSKEGRERGWLKRVEQAKDLNLLNAIQIVIPDNARDGEMATVGVTQADSDGNIRQYTYATTPEEARHQKRIAGLSKDGGGLTPRGDDSKWLHIDELAGEDETL